MTTTGSYHHGNVRAGLVDAALRLIRTEGPAALSLRAATRRIGVSPSAAYRHFTDRDGLLAAVAAAVQERMAEAMQKYWSYGGETATAHLLAVGLGYIHFALDEPGWFAAFFGPDGGHSVFEESGEAGPGPFDLLNRALDELVEEGALSPAARDGAQWPCWSAVHGFAELASTGPLQYLPGEELWQLAELTVERTVAGVLATGSP